MLQSTCTRCSHRREVANHSYTPSTRISLLQTLRSSHISTQIKTNGTTSYYNSLINFQILHKRYFSTRKPSRTPSVTVTRDPSEETASDFQITPLKRSWGDRFNKDYLTENGPGFDTYMANGLHQVGLSKYFLVNREMVRPASKEAYMIESSSNQNRTAITDYNTGHWPILLEAFCKL